MEEKIVKGKIKVENVLAFIQGHIIYYLYYSAFSWLIPTHLMEQISCRINSMKPICYTQGSCISCGCKTTQLQMSFKTCGEKCYPSFLSKRLWRKIKAGEIVYKNQSLWELKDGVFKKYELKREEEKLDV